MAIQDNWRWCNKHRALALAGNGSLGACPAGEQHNHTGSGNYVLAQVSDISGEPGVGASTVLRDAYMNALKPRP
jgi:hypothetical protein